MAQITKWRELLATGLLNLAVLCVASLLVANLIQGESATDMSEVITLLFAVSLCVLGSKLAVFW